MKKVGNYKKLPDSERSKMKDFILRSNSPNTSLKRGICSMLSEISSWGTGHVDLILNGKCIGNAYTIPRGGVKSIRIWVLN